MSSGKNIIISEELNLLFQTREPGFFLPDKIVHIGLYEFCVNFKTFETYSNSDYDLLTRLPLDLGTGNITRLLQAIRCFYKYCIISNVYARTFNSGKLRIHPRLEGLFECLPQAEINLKRTPPLTEVQLMEYKDMIRNYYTVIGSINELYSVVNKENYNWILNEEVSPLTKRMLYDYLKGEVNYYRKEDFYES